MALRSFTSIGAFAIAIALFATGCAATAHVEKDKSANFSQYKTYAWVDKTPAKGKAGKRHQISEQNIKSAVDAQLKKNGWRESNNNPDVMLNYELLIEKNQQQQRDPVYTQPYTRTFYNRYSGRYNTFYYPSEFLGYDEYTSTSKEGTVSITMVDNKTDRTVFQGWATNDISRGNGTVSDKQIDNNVKSIFKKFDPAK